jgi:hypothetical protein
METFQIEHILKNVLGDVFHGVFPSDMIPPVEKYPVAMVCNTDPHDKPGQHWIAMYISDDGIGEYFDSYGQPPFIGNFIEFLNNETTAWFSNEKCL